MNRIWNELLGFETRDIVERYTQQKHKKKLNANRIQQITSNFIQGREYFDSATKADITVRPLLQYYGVMALSKGLILSLDISKTEHQLKKSHGLEVINWNQTLKNKNFENIQIKVCDGTFYELISTTENKNYLRANSTVVNYGSHLTPSKKGDIYTLKQVIQYFPDLKKEYYSWIEEKLQMAQVQKIKFLKKENRMLIELSQIVEDKVIDLIFPDQYCKNKDIKKVNHRTLISYDYNKWGPNISQKWDGTLNIGDIYVVPVLPGDIGLNLLGGMYIISYFLGMLVRYYPTNWIGLKRVEKGDKIFPFVHRILDFVSEKYPIQILDFLNAPYDFER